MTEKAYYYSCAWSKVYTLHFYFSPMVNVRTIKNEQIVVTCDQKARKGTLYRSK